MVNPEILQKLAGGQIRLIDNRIVIGTSSWMLEQPMVVCTLHPKQNKRQHRELLAEILKLASSAAAVALEASLAGAQENPS